MGLPRRPNNSAKGKAKALDGETHRAPELHSMQVRFLTLGPDARSPDASRLEGGPSSDVTEFFDCV